MARVMIRRTLVAFLLFFYTGCSGSKEDLLRLMSTDKISIPESKPSSVQGLIYWFGDSSSVITSSSGKVTKWKSGWSDRLEMQIPVGIGATSGPSVVSLSGGMSALQFNGSNHESLSISGDSNRLFDEATILIHLKSAENIGGVVRLSPSASQISDSVSLDLSSATGLDFNRTTTTNDYFKKSLAMTNGAGAVVAVTSAKSVAAGDIQIFLDGFRLTLADANFFGAPAPLTYTTRDLILGASSTFGSVTIGEVAVYNRVLSPREIYSVSKYFGRRWGVNISTSLTNEVVNDIIDVGVAVASYDRVSREIFSPKGCLGCHNTSNAQGGIDLSTYESTIAATNSRSEKVVLSGRASSSRLIVAVSGSTPTMPQFSNLYGGYLTSDQIQQLTNWINSGLLKNSTSSPLPTAPDPNGGGGGGGGGASTNVVFADVFYGVLSGRCLGCHNSTTASGGINLSTYATTKNGINSFSQALVSGVDPDSSRLYKVVSGVGLAGGLPTMPKGTPVVAIPSAEAQLIKDWILQGAQP